MYHPGSRSLQDAFDTRRIALSDHAPREGHTPPDAAWKQFELFRGVLPRS